jgi:hypothetical protein
VAKPAHPDQIKAKAAEVYASLVKHHRLTAPHHLAMARQISAALLRGDLSEANRGIALLPAPPPSIRVDHSPTPSAADAKEKMWRLFEDNQAAWLHDVASGRAEPDDAGDEPGHDDVEEVAALHRRIESLEDEVKHLRGTRPRRLPAPSKSAMPEISKPKGPIASAAAPAAPSSPVKVTPLPKREPLYRPSEAAWNSWRAAGGDPAPMSPGGSGGESLSSFFRRINGPGY